MSDKLHLISETLTDFSVIDNRGNSVSVQTEEPLAFDKLKGISVACNNGISGRDDGIIGTVRIDGVGSEIPSGLNRPGSGEPVKLPKAIAEMGTFEQLVSGVKLLVTGHVAFDLGDEISPLQTICDEVRKLADKGPSVQRMKC